MNNIFANINNLFDEASQDFIPDGHLTDAHTSEVMSAMSSMGASVLVKESIKKLISSEGAITVTDSNVTKTLTAVSIMNDEGRGFGGLLDQSTFLVSEIMFKKKDNQMILIPRRIFGPQTMYCDRDIDDYNRKSSSRNNILMIIPVTERGWYEYKYSKQFITTMNSVPVTSGEVDEEKNYDSITNKE